MADKSKVKSIKRFSDIKKKKLTKNVIEFINHLNKIDNPEIKVIYNHEFSEGPLWEARDVDPDSDFFFRINSMEIGDLGDTHFFISYRPGSTSRLNWSSFKLKPNIGAFQKPFDSWLKVVKEFNGFTLVLGPEERKLKQHEDEFYNTITINTKLVDEDADWVTFDFETQKKIDDYLEGVLGLLDEYKIKTPKNEERIDDIKREVQELKEEQTMLSKNQFVRKLSKIFAKARAISIHLVHEIGKGIIVDAGKGFILALIG